MLTVDRSSGAIRDRHTSLLQVILSLLLALSGIELLLSHHLSLLLLLLLLNGENRLLCRVLLEDDGSLRWRCWVVERISNLFERGR